MTQLEAATVAASMMIAATAGFNEINKSRDEMLIQVEKIKDATCIRITGKKCQTKAIGAAPNKSIPTGQ